MCLKYKLEAEAESMKHWDPKRKKHVALSLSFKSKAVRDFFSSLKNAKSDVSEFKKALQLPTKCYRKTINCTCFKTVAIIRKESTKLCFLH